MSGHSKWSTIKRQKGAADAKRGNLFTKLSNAISIAVREGGGGDPNFNFKLRLAVDKAKEANMPKDNIARAIDKGLGKGGAIELQTAFFEGFGPEGVAVIVEAITDNTNRTGGEVRSIFDRSGGRMATVGYMFTRVGEIRVSNSINQSNSNPINFDNILEKAIEAGAEDVEEDLIYTKPEDLHRVKLKLEELGLTVTDASLSYRPNKDTIMTLSEEQAGKVMEFVGKLEDLDDVQNVFVNF